MLLVVSAEEEEEEGDVTHTTRMKMVVVMAVVAVLADRVEMASRGRLCPANGAALRDNYISAEAVGGQGGRGGLGELQRCWAIPDYVVSPQVWLQVTWIFHVSSKIILQKV